uniref:AB hydrolase-1 domain-containing protein n=1 Tax=Rhabditophanes sp. KR3021 TaxID=114890 RepID=A0AC35U7D1_9BILA
MAKSADLQAADLLRDIPDNSLDLVQEAFTVFIRESLPPFNYHVKGTILLLHGQAYTSYVWQNSNMMQIFSAMGFHCIAPDLPGQGRTEGTGIADKEKPRFFSLLIDTLYLKRVIVVAASMAGQYILPLLPDFRITCLVAIALSDSKMPPERSSVIKTPTLVLWGDKDTSLGPICASNLKNLPFVKLIKIPSATHACHESNPKYVQTVILNFLDLITEYDLI